MLLDDLKAISNNNRRATRDRAVLKLETDMLYYMILEQVMTHYGTDATNAMYKVDMGVLGAARDQMAMLASEQGLTASSGEIRNANNIQDFITAGFKNSEAIRQTIATHLASNNPDAWGLDEKDTNARIDQEIDRITNFGDPNSPASNVLANYRVMHEHTRTTASPYRSAVHEHTMDHDTGKKVFTTAERPVYLISPLMPEAEALFRVRPDLRPAFTANSEYKGFLEYDPELGLLYRAGDEDLITNAERGAEYRRGVQVMISDHQFDDSYESVRIENRPDLNTIPEQYAIYDEDGMRVEAKDDLPDIYKNPTEIRERGQGYDASQVTRSLVAECQWRMVYTLEKYSNYPLNDSDIEAIYNMFEPASGTPTGEMLFGTMPRNIDPNSQSDRQKVLDAERNIRETMDAYFDYIGHMCSTVRESMSSHEFEIHFTDVFPNSSSNVKMMYFTGERGGDFQKSARNGARFLGVYAYSNYSMDKQSENNNAVWPVAGDIRPGGFNTFAVTSDMSHKGTAAANPYMHTRQITAEMVGNMRKTFDLYMSDSNMRSDRFNELHISRINSRMGQTTGVDDMSEWISGDTIKADEIIAVLKKDRDSIIEDRKHIFQADMNRTAVFDAVTNNVLDRLSRIYGYDDDLQDAGSLNEYLVRMQEYFNDPIVRNDPDFGRKAMFDVAMQAMDAALKSQFDVKSDDYLVNRCIYGRYLAHYMNDLLDGRTDADSTDYLLDKANEYVLDESLHDMFGQDDPDNSRHTVIKTNMCSRYSKQFMENQYRNMLQLVSYSDKSTYEQAVGKSLDRVFDDMQTDTSSNLMTVQLFSTASYDSRLTGSEADSRQDDLEEDGTTGGDDVSEINDNAEAEDDDTMGVDDIFFSDHMWHASTFAKTDLSVDKNIRLFESADQSEDAVVYRATHPLQTRAMQLVRENLRRTLGSEYRSENLNITDSGIIYYKNGDNLQLKLGPVLDEKAYIRPYMDANGMSYSGPMTHNGQLLNDVVFGALDLSNSLQSVNAVPNRVYGISAKVDNYDGYGHQDRSFFDRTKYSTYQMGVLQKIQEDMNLFEITRHTNASDGDSMASEKAKSIFYTNVSASSLMACYRTNTYLIMPKEKCAVVDEYLSNYFDAEKREALVNQVFPSEEFPDMTLEDKFTHMNRIADQTLMQMQMSRNRVVHAKIDVDHNIGLYNLVINMAQASNNAVLGTVDRMALRKTDMRSGRVSIFMPNSRYDVISGTATQLGAVAYFTTDVRLDRFTGRLIINSDADKNSRSLLVAEGIQKFDPKFEGEADTVHNYPGGQAVDRLQLSANGMLKSINYAPELKFAMVNLGDNMEDGYIITKRAAEQLGHIGDDGVYHAAEVWDKIGDEESGNKGVISRIIDTDMTEDEFKIQFVKDYLFNFYFNNATKSDEMAHNMITKLNQMSSNALGIVSEDSELGRKALEYMGDWDGFMDYYNSPVNSEQAVKLDEDDYYRNMLGYMTYMDEKVEPFYSEYSLALKQWQLFKDNPGLDVVMGNACVYTRSNPSLLMYIRDNAEKNPDDARIIMREENDSLKSYEGACGRMLFYVDVNTGSHKNRYYMDDKRKDGRGYGSQENFALNAKHANGEFIKKILENDSTFGKRLVKLNRKLSMNGFIVDAADNMAVKPISEYLKEQISDEEDARKDPSQGIPIGVDNRKYELYLSKGLNGSSIVDLPDYAQDLAEKFSGQFKTADKDQIMNMIKELGNLNFSPFLTGGAQAGMSQSQDDFLRYFFDDYIGVNGGGYIMMPSELGSLLSIHHVIDPKTDMAEQPGEIDGRPMYLSAVMPESLTETWAEANNLTAMRNGRMSVAPLFLSANEILDDESNVVRSHVDDRLQLDAYKTIVAYGILTAMKDMYPDNAAWNAVMTSSEISDIKNSLKERLARDYENMGHQKSLTTDNLSNWLKKNIFKTTFPNSMTCVWAGDCRLGIDEVGISFDQAKKLGVLKLKENVRVMRSGQLMFKDPDTGETYFGDDSYQNMNRFYEPIAQDATILVNRSPGQTTGCIRAFRPRIMSAHGDGLKIHPALATIFDGDFDGDTVGVLAFQKGDHTKATRELNRTMSMQANLIHTADYTEIKIPGTDHKIEYVNPLFIAGNADVAIAKEVMRIEQVKPDIDETLDRITIRANIVEQVKQLCYEMTNDNISDLSYAKLYKARMDQITALRAYDPADPVISNILDPKKSIFADMMSLQAIARKDSSELIKNYGNGSADESELHAQLKSYNEKAQKMDFKHSGPKIDSYEYQQMQDKLETLMGRISTAERDNMAALSKQYKLMTKYIAKSPCFTHGGSDYEMLERIIDDANISKKGKEPQLNALLSFAGVHADCPGKSGEYGLCVCKNESGRFEIQMPGKDGYHRPNETERRELIENIKINYKNAKSDLPEDPFKSELESHSAAQADKSDATGLGGAMAQKFQKIFAIFGHGEFAMRITGPITQKFLDAKQNVKDCATNLTIGKFVLDNICKFHPIKELVEFKEGETYVDANGNERVREASDLKDGQFTVMRAKDNTIEQMSIQDSVHQIDVFLKMMKLPGLSPVDKAMMESSMSSLGDGENVPADIISKCDEIGNKSFALMYGNKYSTGVFYDMAQNHAFLFDNSIYAGNINSDKILRDVQMSANRSLDREVVRSIINAYDERSDVENIANQLPAQSEKTVMSNSMADKIRENVTVASETQDFDDDYDEIDLKSSRKSSLGSLIYKNKGSYDKLCDYRSKEDARAANDEDSRQSDDTDLPPQ